jgi:hypothetical protein
MFTDKSTSFLYKLSFAVVEILSSTYNFKYLGDLVVRFCQHSSKEVLVKKA